ncbi:hypothetical protein ACJMK2_020055 [Sinanodonta woodiana]|uniref:ER membrane protein complex subunit 10 n=1 Tax=Sinanodonta woodiana TaxID=1069815 RepID=A0ABD3TXV7_SINWO
MAAPMIQMMMLLFIGFMYLSTVMTYEDEYEGLRTLTLEHALDRGPNPEYTKRGSILIKSVKKNKAHFSSIGPVTFEEKRALRRLVEENGIYRIRVPLKGTGEKEDYVSTFIPACSVYESALSDQLIVSVDQSGEVIGISIMGNPSHCSGLDVPDSNLTNWNTMVEISQTIQGPVPDTQTYIERMKREEQAKAQGQQGDNRSFIAKYWMYIVPFVIIVFLMQSMDQQGGQEGAGGGGGR